MRKYIKTIYISTLIFFIVHLIMPISSHAVSEPIIDDLIRHFQNAGLSVEEKATPPASIKRGRKKISEREKEDKRFAEHREKLKEMMAQRRKDNTLYQPKKPKASKDFPIETKNVILESVHLSIERYAHVPSAQQGYERMVHAQKWQEESDQKAGRPYFKVTFYHHGPFVLKILHYKLKEAYEGGPLEKKEIYIDGDTLSRIEKAFESFHF